MTRRVVLDVGPLSPGHTVPLDRKLARYLRGSLRLVDGEQILVVDGSGGVFDAVLESGSLRIERPCNLPVAEAAPCRIEILQAVPKGDKMSEIVRRVTELGAEQVVPMITERTIVRPAEAGARVRRWRRVAREAARQCGRRTPPRIADMVAFSDALAAGSGSVKLMMFEAERVRLLRDVLSAAAAAGARPSVSALVGPEGGFTADEVGQAERAGFVKSTLGPRILRTETVALTLCAVLQHVWGDLG